MCGKKVLGYGEYPDDVEMEGMVYASAVRSKYPRAKVLDIDVSKALELPGVLAVLTAEDVPNNKVGHLQQDWDVMIAKGSVTRCVGDAICLVVAETREILEKAKKLVKISYEELKPVTSIAEAMAEDAPKVSFQRKSLPEQACDKRGCEESDCELQVCSDAEIYNTVYRTRLPGTGVCGGVPLQGWNKSTLLRPGSL